MKAVTAVILFGCARPSTSQSPAPTPAPDHSFDGATFIAKGMPAPDREWTGEDYGQALSVLQPLAKADATTLPRRVSANSAQLFSRMVSDTNLNLVRSPALPASQRLAPALSMLEGTSKLLSLYAAATTSRATFDDELCDLMAFMLDESVAINRLADEFMRDLPAEQREIPARVQGRAQISSGMASVVSGALTTLTESKVYRVPPRIRLANALAIHLPSLYRYLPPGTQQEVKVRLGRLAAEADDDGLRAAITSVSRALSTAQPPGA